MARAKLQLASSDATLRIGTAGWSLPARHEISQVQADPERCPLAPEHRARVEGFTYLRLHGSPEIYKSKYSSEWIERAATELSRAQAEGRRAWCIFDNTTFGHATADALALKARLVPARRARNRVSA